MNSSFCGEHSQYQSPFLCRTTSIRRACFWVSTSHVRTANSRIAHHQDKPSLSGINELCNCRHHLPIGIKTFPASKASKLLDCKQKLVATMWTAATATLQSLRAKLVNPWSIQKSSGKNLKPGYLWEETLSFLDVSNMFASFSTTKIYGDIDIVCLGASRDLNPSILQGSGLSWAFGSMAQKEKGQWLLYWWKQQKDHNVHISWSN